jgi:histidinol dehydrogenase
MNRISTKKRDFQKAFLRIVNRSEEMTGRVNDAVLRILKEIREKGDRALVRYTELFDQIKLKPSELRLTRGDVKRAYQITNPGMVMILKKAAKRIERFHKRQKEKSRLFKERYGVTLGQLINPIGRVGIYVPGGKASYPSSVLMNAIPARVAGVKEIVMCVPTKEGEIDPYVIVAADIAGVDEIFLVGGAQAIGAMAYGTKSIKRVDKIVGPGNIYVATAKKLVFGQVDIDMIAGPSEIVVLADRSGRPDFIAADLLSQAEHDESASSILITPMERLADEVMKEIEKQMQTLSRKSIIKKSLKKHGWVIIVKSIREGIELVNEIAPEHFELAVSEPFRYLDQVKNAGAVFLGHYSSEVLGDYMAGPNHVLPTGGTSRFFSPLGVYDFIKRSSVIFFTREGLKEIGEEVCSFANLEGLDAHANSVKIRGLKIK